MKLNNQNGIENELPRRGSALYNLNHPDSEIRKKILKKYKRINKYLVIPLYLSRLLPLLGFGRIFLILTTLGRKTGKKRKTPLEYHRIDGVITIFSGRGEEAGWLKNIRANPESVWVRHGFHFYQPRIKFVINETDKLNIVKWYVINHKRSAKFLFGWNPKMDNPEIVNFSKLLNSITIIQLL
ncbi:MAG: nitroreductase family deazaflavin-dependent oxidoreductase [Candidatus Hodarchaeota archaeon]